MDFELWWILASALIAMTLVGVYKLALAVINRNASRAIRAELEERISRIEYAMDATAVEVERIGESQRFLTRVLTEQGAPALVRQVAPERATTPH